MHLDYPAFNIVAFEPGTTHSVRLNFNDQTSPGGRSWCSRRLVSLIVANAIAQYPEVVVLPRSTRVLWEQIEIDHAICPRRSPPPSPVPSPPPEKPPPESMRSPPNAPPQAIASLPCRELRSPRSSKRPVRENANKSEQGGTRGLHAANRPRAIPGSARNQTRQRIPRRRRDAEANALRQTQHPAGRADSVSCNSTAGRAKRPSFPRTALHLRRAVPRSRPRRLPSRADSSGRQRASRQHLRASPRLGDRNPLARSEPVQSDSQTPALLRSRHGNGLAARPRRPVPPRLRSRQIRPRDRRTRRALARTGVHAREFDGAITPQLLAGQDFLGSGSRRLLSASLAC